MMRQATAPFSQLTWIRAMMAQVPGARLLSVPEMVNGQGSPRLAVALQSHRLPLSYHESWITPLTSTGLPAASAMPSAQDAVTLLERVSTPIVFRSLPEGHPTTDALLAASSHHHFLDRWERAALNISGTFDAWLMENFDHKRRKELKRLRARLSEQGTFTVSHLGKGDDLAPYIAAFLALERKGWKGKRGTAIENDPRLVKGLEQGLAGLHRSGNVRFWMMQLDGKPVAAMFALIDGEEATLGKIAHDETLSKFSPGVQIILEATEALFAEPGLQLADSNAIPNHPMINRIWRDRVSFMDVVLAGPSVTPSAFNGLTRYLGMKHAVRSSLKQAFLRLTGRKQS
jgi:CelD/BcsL family acetyltransferase involved in cellulose biosynthesis